VKIVLQHIRTSLYLREPGAWTRSFDEALDFVHSKRAIDYATKYRLSGVQGVVAFIESGVLEAFAFAIKSRAG
jgi:hypothetical protein